MSLLTATLEQNDTMTDQGVRVQNGADIKWIDPAKYGFVRQLFEGTDPVMSVGNPEAVAVAVDGQPATFDTPIGHTTRTVEVRKPLGKKG